MFQSIINRAQHSVESVLTKYVLRAVVAVPFLIACGFGTAAATVKLVQIYGHTEAYALVSAAFAVLGLLTAALIAISGSKPAVAASETVADVKPETPETAAKSLFDADLLVAALGVVGPKALPAVPAMMRFVVRNWALVVALVVVAYLAMSEEQKSQTDARQQYS